MATVFVLRTGRRSLVFVIAVLLAVVTHAGFLPEVAAAQDAAGTDPPWLATYWNNLTLTGNPALTRVEPAIDYDWGYGSPDPSVNPQRFSARWTQSLCLGQAETYHFVLTSDDGARLYVDNQLVINGWWAHGIRTFTSSRQLAPGCHELRVEYFEQSGIALVQFEAALTDVTPPSPPPTPSPQPPAPALPQVFGAWRGEYYNNRYLVGAPVLVRDDPAINYDWGYGSPAPGVVNSDNFSVRWTQSLNFPAGLYRFRVTVDDGVRLYVDGRLVIDQWREQGVSATQSPDLNLSGPTPIRLEYFEATGQALVQLTFELVGGAPALPEAWLGEYFNNSAVLGAPVLVRNDPAIDFNWGYGSPASEVVNHDNFSARWSRVIYFSPGTYRFRITVDDGARLWVNNALIIDRWQQQAATEATSDLYLPGGSVPVRLEYVEYTGEATIRLTWELASSGGGGGGGSVDTGESTKTIKPKSKWDGEYYNNRDLDGSPALVRADSAIDFDWGHGSPASGIDADDFSARWTNTFRLDSGKYRFTAEYDDGARVYVDGKLVIDDWRVGSIRKQSTEFHLASGDHTVVMEYFERTGVAIARLRIVQFVSGSAPIGNLITCVPPQPQNYAWIKLYRLDGNNDWYAISKGIGSINASGFLKIDGLPVDVNRFGASGEPYKVEQWIDSRVVQSTGDFYAGQPEFRIRPWADNATPFGCP